MSYLGFFVGIIVQVFCTLAAELGTIPTIPGPVTMWPYAVPPWPFPWAAAPQGYAYPMQQPQLLPPQPLPQDTPTPHDPWSVAGGDPWAAAAASAAAAAATSVAGAGMGHFPGSGAGQVPLPPTYPAPGMGNFGAQS